MKAPALATWATVTSISYTEFDSGSNATAIIVLGSQAPY